MAETMTGAARTAPPRRAVRTGAATTLVIACASVLLVLMDYNAPLVTVPQISAAYGAGPSGQTWLINGIVLGLAATMLIMGSLADDFGRRRVFVIGTALFAVGCATGGAAPATVAFVLLRLVQGVGAAAMLTASVGLVTHAYPAGPARIRATGLWGSMIGLGIAVGPLVSASLATAWNWRGCYWIYAAAAVVIAVITPRLVPESRAEQRHSLDVPGVATLGIGLTLLLAGVTEGRNGWARPEVAALFAGAAVALAGFAAIELRRREPMLDLRLFRRPDFLVATIGALVTGLAVIGFMSYLPTVFQRTMHMSSLGSALPFTVWAGLSFLVSMQARRLPGAARWQIAAGLVLAAIGYAILLGAVDAGEVGRVYAGFAVSGFGSGLLNASLARLAVESVPAGRGSMGSGANQTARYVGSSTGVALAVLLITGLSVNAGLLTVIVLSLAGAAVAALVRAHR